MTRPPPCPLCDREAPRPFGRKETWRCNCATKPNVNFQDGSVFQIIGNFIVSGNRDKCVLKRFHKDVQEIDVDIRDVYYLSSETIETIWKTKSWAKLKKISSFI